MENVKPLPLLKPRNPIKSYSNDTDQLFSLRTYGYLILAATWIIFIVTTCSLLGIWDYIIFPLSLSSSTDHLHSQLSSIFRFIESSVLKAWGIYVVLWWWAISSWIGLKLFRHSKGIQAELDKRS
ncbi:hypothetical protein PGUG_03538 [Meyerozyma guilliermondii ATCC 6260]|uniref:Uncharacterized protein n=1 Tax=Meyerozyma guilliermondii (strain ATCC 6260 / CBS 566 / DSM 6381 / JCM 1539 / NBRC 10279 / NRRL Y-324) TaxID=294746 RepID=A5DJT7_PICGU|nr:uncharacterized protein PGUG_03538 [Meyerozyma guilliermondii ATCC 6260]EDK39440.2 hypothetical protein PGUG_03538 [Meyerozyma guilliermondii ATCC 6260]